MTTKADLDYMERCQELTQKLYNEAGYQGNVYTADPELLRRFENQAVDIVDIAEDIAEE